MNAVRKIATPILLATIWISLSEFIRNQLLFRSLWLERYQELSIPFPSAPINGVVWVAWSFLLAIAIFTIAKKFTTTQTTLLSWMMVFPMMWLVLGNLAVLPYDLLPYAIPLSILETFLATLIVKKLHRN